MSKRLLKFALSALLLTASASVYADDAQTTGPVQLGNGESVSWSDFASVINGDLSTLQGDTISVPATNKAKIAMWKAQAALSTANGELGDAIETVKDRQADVERDSTAAVGKDSAATLAASTYNTARTNVQTWTGQQSSLNTDITLKNGQVRALNSAISDSTLALYNKWQPLQNEFNDSIKEFQALVKAQTTTKTSEVTADWWETMQTKANQFNEFLHNYGEGTIYETYKNSPIYYKFSLSTGLVKTRYLDICFSTMTGDNWIATTFDGFVQAMLTDVTPVNGQPAAKKPGSIRIYYGYTDNIQNTDKPGNLFLTITNTVTTWDSETVGETLALIYPAINNYVNIPKVEKTVTTTNEKGEEYYNGRVTYWQGQLAKITNTEKTGFLDKCNAKITENTAKRNKLESEISADEETLQTNQKEIDKYTTKDPETGLTELDRLQKAMEDAEAEKKTADENLAASREARTTAYSNLKDMQNAVAEAQKNVASCFETLQAEANAIAQGYYKNIVLTSDIDADVAITKNFEGTIDANNHFINVKVANLFTSLRGSEVSNAIINGSFTASTGSAYFNNVIRWNPASTTPGLYYNADGQSTPYTDIFELGYAARNLCGVNLTGNNTGTLTQATPATKVYQVTVMNRTGVQPIYYVQVNSKGELVNSAKTVYTLPVNTFAKSTTADIAGLGTTNVYYGVNNDCDNAVIKDKNDFYCPENIKAAKVSYTRDFQNGTKATEESKAYYGFNALCLPFDMPTSITGDDKAIRSISVFETVLEDKQEFHFTQYKNASSIPAYTPFLLLVNKEMSIKDINLTDVNIIKTDKQIVVDQAATNHPSVAYGTLINTDWGALNGASQSPYIYGLNSSGRFQAAKSTANVSAFRMMIGTKESVIKQNAMKRAPGEYVDEYKIVILDEDGNDILADKTSGIQGVATDAASFNVTTAQGQIIIESDADYGKVEIYSVDGRLAAVANVTVGTTTVDVNAGVYIVMGKKVLVK